MKLILLLFLLSLIPKSALLAQETKTDSTAIKVKTAIADAKHFKLDKQVWKAFRKHHFAYTSDYFKPNIANVSGSNLLTDSAYVKAFKKAAYEKTAKRRTVGHYILGGYLVGIIIYVFVLFIELATGSLRI